MRDAERCRSFAQMNPDGVGRDPHCPKQAVGERGDTRVEVVDLRGELGEVKLTFEDIQSDKAEGTVMDLPVYSNVFALHEAHVSIEEQAVRPSALDLGGANEAI